MDLVENKASTYQALFDSTQVLARPLLHVLEECYLLWDMQRLACDSCGSIVLCASFCTYTSGFSADHLSHDCRWRCRETKALREMPRRQVLLDSL